MRFTLCKLFLAVTLLGLACAGMTLRTNWWAISIVSLSIVLYIALAITTIGLRGQARAFRLSAAIAGSGYLLLILSPVFAPLRALLVTDKILVILASTIHAPPQSMALPAYGVPSTYYVPTVSPNLTPATDAPADAAPAPVPDATEPTPTPAPDNSATPADSIQGSNSTITTAQPTLSAPPPFYPPPVNATWTIGNNIAWTDPSLAQWGVVSGIDYTSRTIAFLIIGHCVWSWLIALLAGSFAAIIYARRERATQRVD